jgi:2',3'-cyclic-nucleotide 2'-phosphodiesterase (5'-nucleotidase family)
MKKQLLPYFILCFFYNITSAQDILVNYRNYAIEAGKIADTTVNQMLLPYKDSLQKQMKQVLGFSLQGMFKKQPESGLGNFIADGMKQMAEKKFEQKVDAAIVNYGGLRHFVPKGEITLGTLADIMPFENQIVLQEINGKLLQELLNITAEKGGWPVSGIEMHIQQKKAVQIKVNHSPLDENKMYKIACTDYIANGGDGCRMLQGVTKQYAGYSFLDALKEYCLLQTGQYKPIDCRTENRVVYDN